jgi:hypothetical protein
VKKNIWNEETGINLKETVLRAVPPENQDSILLLVQEDSDAKPPLVMFRARSTSTIQVFALTQAVKN